MKQKVTIVFPSIIQLWQFVNTTNIPSVEINTTNNTLYCECEIRNILLAENAFNARVVERAIYFEGILADA
jgi:hypothetical protein